MAKIAIRTFVSLRLLDRCMNNNPFSTLYNIHLTQRKAAMCRHSYATSAALPDEMLALVIKNFGKEKELFVARVPFPDEIQEEILVRVEAAGINPVDTYIREGIYNKELQLPAILGKEVAGVIMKIGSNVTANPYSLKVGDRVFCRLPHDKGYAQYVSCVPEDVIPLHNRLTFSQGAGLYVAYYTAYRGLIIRCNLKKGETVLVHGASGGVGIAAIQIAKHYGAFVAATAGTDEGLELIKNQGADYTINHRRRDHLLVAKKALGDKGFDVIFENVADIHLGDDTFVLAPEGRIAIVGCRGSVDITPRNLMATEGQMVGVTLMKMTPEELKECTDFILAGIEERWVNPVVGKEYTLDEGPKAHYDMINKPVTLGKLVFKMNKDKEFS